MITFACLGHWYGQLLFAAPCVGALGLIVRDTWRRKKAPPGGKPRRPRPAPDS